MLEVVVHKTEITDIIALCMEQNPKAQKLLYDRTAPKVLSICRQYFSDMYTAENVMISSLVKIFKNLEAFRSEGSFYAWVHRITVNQCIDQIRKDKKDLLDFSGNMVDDGFAIEYGVDFETKDALQEMIDRLPQNCKIIFNLYVIDGYKHQEISEMLNISEGTSKSQLAYARKLLQSMVKQDKMISI